MSGNRKDSPLFTTVAAIMTKCLRKRGPSVSTIMRWETGMLVLPSMLSSAEADKKCAQKIEEIFIIIHYQGETGKALGGCLYEETAAALRCRRGSLSTVNLCMDGVIMPCLLWVNSTHLIKNMVPVETVLNAVDVMSRECSHWASSICHGTVLRYCSW